MSGLGRRVAGLEAAERERLAGLDPTPWLMIIMPDEWPAAELAAYEAAGRAGDGAAWAAVIGRNAGQRPGPRTRVVAIRERPDGPQ